MSRNSRALPAIVAVLALCCCLETLFGVAAIAYFASPPDEQQPIAEAPPATATATATRILARTVIAPAAAPTFSPTRPRVNSPTIRPPTAIRVTPSSGTPVAGGGLYDAVVPTPTAPPLVYPIEYKSAMTVATYTVTGKTLNEISAALEQNALADPHEAGSKYYARTNWLIQGTWSWKPSPRGCEVERGAVSVTITITLPALKTTAGVPPDIVNRWNTFIRNTNLHEQGHAKLALQGARDYQRNLGNLAPAPNCDILQKQLRDLYNRDFETIDRVNVQYDKDTEHGLTQGAVFP